MTKPRKSAGVAWLAFQVIDTAVEVVWAVVLAGVALWVLWMFHSFLDK